MPSRCALRRRVDQEFKMGVIKGVAVGQNDADAVSRAAGVIDKADGGCSGFIILPAQHRVAVAIIGGVAVIIIGIRIDDEVTLMVFKDAVGANGDKKEAGFPRDAAVVLGKRGAGISFGQIICITARDRLVRVVGQAHGACRASIADGGHARPVNHHIVERFGFLLGLTGPMPRLRFDDGSRYVAVVGAIGGNIQRVKINPAAAVRVIIPE